MDLTPTADQSKFREELRAWLAANHPGPTPTSDDEHFNWRRSWQRRLHEGRWAGVHWPVEYGGRGATVVESAIFFEELGRARAPLPANVLGLLLAGPTLMKWATPEQQAEYLGPILSADEIWCQGFSEPDAGSDLAAAKTRAVRDGDDWVVTGQKVWTSFAQHAKRCMLLARTDSDVPKHKGLTYFVLDMETDGVQVRPLRQITGGSEFNELFLEEVRVPDSAVVGGVNNGWLVAMTTLMNERSGIGFFLQVEMRQLLDRIVAELRRRGQLEDPTVRRRIAELHARTEVLRLTSYRGLSAIQKYGQPGPESSLTKWMWSRTNQEIAQFAIDAIGPEALASDSPWSFDVLRARGNSIEGGTTEILKNIVAERVLGLPRGR
jgi:alkylation response protein AidB-like acyl-CoA dehydrogenase